MKHLLSAVGIIVVTMPGILCMESPANDPLRPLLQKSIKLVDSLNKSYHGEYVLPISSTFRACKRSIISHSSNETLTGLKRYTSKRLLVSSRSSKRIKQLLSSLCTSHASSDTIQVIMHDNLCRLLKEKVPGLEIDHTTKKSKKFGNYLSMVPEALKNLHQLSETDVATIAECTLAYAIASVVGRGYHAGSKVLPANTLDAQALALYDALIDQPILGVKNKSYKEIAKNTSDICIHISKLLKRNDFKPLEKVTLHGLITHADNLEAIRDVIRAVFSNYSQQFYALSKIYKSHQALSETLSSQLGITIEHPDILEGAPEDPIYIALKSAPEFSKEQIDQISFSLFGYMLLQNLLF